MRSGASADEAAFLEWLAPWWETMRRVAQRLAPWGEAEDALQNALVAAWRHRRRFDERRGDASAWLTTITANEARKLHRRRHKTELLVDDWAAADPHSSGMDLRAAVSLLPARQALAVNLRYYIGLSIKETAMVMGCAEGTVKSTLAAARASLARSLEEEYR